MAPTPPQDGMGPLRSVNFSSGRGRGHGGKDGPHREDEGGPGDPEAAHDGALGEPGDGGRSSSGIGEEEKIYDQRAGEAAQGLGTARHSLAQQGLAIGALAWAWAVTVAAGSF